MLCYSHPLTPILQFLIKSKLMDYSLLVGIYHAKDVRATLIDYRIDDIITLQDEHVQVDTEKESYYVPNGGGSIRVVELHLTSTAAGNDQYFLGIIDALTFYGALKKAAHTAKELKHGVSATDSHAMLVIHMQRINRVIESLCGIMSITSVMRLTTLHHSATLRSRL